MKILILIAGVALATAPITAVAITLYAKPHQSTHTTNHLHSILYLCLLLNDESLAGIQLKHR